MQEDKKDYEVGYCQPPMSTRFKPGQSGNAKGRPKSAKSLATLLKKAMNEKVIITENGKRRSISKLEAAVKQLINKAAGGDHRAMGRLFELIQMTESRDAEMLALAPEIDRADHLVADSIIRRLRQCASQEPESQAERRAKTLGKAGDGTESARV